MVQRGLPRISHCMCITLLQNYTTDITLYIQTHWSRGNDRDREYSVKIIWSVANQNTCIIVCAQTQCSKPNKNVGVTMHIHVHTRSSRGNDSIDITVNIQQTYWTEPHGRTHTKVYIQTRWSKGNENMDVRVRLQSHCSKASVTTDITLHVHTLFRSK
jgi:hypothetical protein